MYMTIMSAKRRHAACTYRYEIRLAFAASDPYHQNVNVNQKRSKICLST